MSAHVQTTAQKVSPGVQREEAIVVENFSKSYGSNRVVNHLHFTVQRGEVFALLGPNGAGKTTTVEILEGYRTPDHGEVRVLGLDPRRNDTELKQRIGVMLQNGGIYPTISPLELLKLFGLEESISTRYKRLSGGQQRRLVLAAALIGRPELLFLDEPTTGMDPQARRLTWEIIQSLRNQGLTVLLTTHFMEEAERLADRVAIIDHGKLLTLEETQVLTHTNSEELQFTAPPGLDCLALAALPAAQQAREIQPGYYAIETTRPIDLLAEVTAWARTQGILLNDLRVGHESLEEVFLRLTGHELRE